jgi:hypothetical protein
MEATRVKPKYKVGDILCWDDEIILNKPPCPHFMLVTRVRKGGEPMYFGLDLSTGDPDDWASVEFIDNRAKNLEVI